MGDGFALAATVSIVLNVCATVFVSAVEYLLYRFVFSGDQQCSCCNCFGSEKQEEEESNIMSFISWETPYIGDIEFKEQPLQKEPIYQGAWLMVGAVIIVACSIPWYWVPGYLSPNLIGIPL